MNDAVLILSRGSAKTALNIFIGRINGRLARPSVRIFGTTSVKTDVKPDHHRPSAECENRPHFSTTDAAILCVVVCPAL